jgi:hypothetical protein
MPGQIPSNLPDLYQRLLIINHEAFTSGAYDVAYHALMGALHCVQTLHDLPGVRTVARVAQEQLAWIDQYHPEYEHSTQAARRRGHPSIYHTLSQQAGALIRMIETEAALKNKG